MDKAAIQQMADEAFNMAITLPVQVKEFQVRPPEDMQAALEIVRQHAGLLAAKVGDLRNEIAKL